MCSNVSASIEKGQRLLQKDKTFCKTILSGNCWRSLGVRVFLGMTSGVKQSISIWEHKNSTWGLCAKGTEGSIEDGTRNNANPPHSYYVPPIWKFIIFIF